MGIYDRDYYRQTPFSTPWGSAPGQIVKLLIILNVSVLSFSSSSYPTLMPGFLSKHRGRFIHIGKSGDPLHTLFVMLDHGTF